MQYVKCQCLVCNKEFEVMAWKLNQGRGKYCSIECRRIAQKRAISGSNHYAWNGGVSKKGGHILIYKPDHPHAKANGYVFEHRLVMEAHLGRYLRPDEVIHHLNHIKTDNRIENLIIVTKYDHRGHHKKYSTKAERREGNRQAVQRYRERLKHASQ